MWKFGLIFGLLFALSACGDSKTQSGGPVAQAPVAPPSPVDPAPPTRVPGEPATRCLADIQVRTNRTALVRNSCGFDINVGQMNSRFSTPAPITLIKPGQTVAVKLGDDSLTIGFGACRAPSIPQPADAGFFTCSSIPAQGKAGKVVEGNPYPLFWFTE